MKMFNHMIDWTRVTIAVIGTMVVFCLYLVATLDTIYAALGALVSATIMWLTEKLKDQHHKNVRFRILTALAGTHVALVPAITLAWIKRVEIFTSNNVSLTDLMYSIAPISTIMLIGVMVGLERQEAAKEYSKRDDKTPRFYNMERSKNIKSCSKK